MPIYEYVCEDCHRLFEKLVLKRDDAIACPSCGSTRYTMQFSVTAAPAKSGNGEAAGPNCACTPTTCGCN